MRKHGKTGTDWAEENLIHGARCVPSISDIRAETLGDYELGKESKQITQTVFRLHK